jgi:hypothetical protein
MDCDLWRSGLCLFVCLLLPFTSFRGPLLRSERVDVFFNQNCYDQYRTTSKEGTFLFNYLP